MTGEELRQIRTRLGLTQGEFASRLGVWLNTVSRWEIGERKIPEPVARLAQLIAAAERSKKKGASR
jgi:transcriptional regulator with XRE-family HTH domain